MLFQNGRMNDKLPNEVLANIFRLNAERNLVLDCCRFHLPGNREGDTIVPPLQDTLNASQVCRNWRAVAVGCPELWRHFIDPHHNSFEWIQIVLERSEPYDITYYGSLSGRAIMEEELIAEAEFADRLVSYSVAFNAPEGEDENDCDVWNSEKLPLQWPKLKFLCITHRLDNLPREGFSADCFALLEQALPEDFPCLWSTPILERLHLHGCFTHVPEQIIELQTLTELRVHFFRVFSAYNWINEVLLKLPNLKTVTLDNAIVLDSEIS